VVRSLLEDARDNRNLQITVVAADMLPRSVGDRTLPRLAHRMPVVIDEEKRYGAFDVDIDSV
jgi:hypothetical protein